jgi:hypothetical protein
VKQTNLAPQLDRTSAGYLDIQAGLNYAYFPDENTYFNVGFSSMHVNRPRESFFDAKAGIDNRIAVRHTAFINGSFKLNDQWIFNPNSYFSLQAKSTEWLIGANAHYNLSGDGQNVLIGGVLLPQRRCGNSNGWTRLQGFYFHIYIRCDCFHFKRL